MDLNPRFPHLSFSFCVYTYTLGGKNQFAHSEWFRMDENGPEWVGMACEWLRMAGNGCKWFGMAANGSEWMGMDPNGWELIEMDRNVTFDPLVLTLDL